MTPLRGLTDPVGPESPQTYWVRRLVLLVAVVVVVALVIAGIAKLVGGTKEAAAPEASSFTPDPLWTDTAWGSATPSASSSAVSPVGLGAGRNPHLHRLRHRQRRQRCVKAHSYR